MRFLISMFVISTLALLPAMSQAACPAADRATESSDYELPAYGTFQDISKCSFADWDVYFHRTAKSEERTIVWFQVEGTNMLRDYDSTVYSEGDQHFNGRANVNGMSVRPKIYLDATHNACGHFTTLRLLVEYTN